MKKKKGRSQYDDFFSNGIMELGRIGNVVTLKNNMSEEQAEKNRERMADDYAEKKAEIDNLIVKIRTNVSQCNPLHLLECATAMGM